MRTSSLAMKFWYAKHCTPQVDIPSVKIKQRRGERKCYRVSVHVRTSHLKLINTSSYKQQNPTNKYKG